MTTSTTLIIVTHPDINHSKINKRWCDELEKNQELVTVHQLHQQYPNGEIDVKAEQALLLAHDTIIFQFPFYWFSTPPLLKKWLDDVLAHGFAYGSEVTDRQLCGKRMGLAISAGIKAYDYDKNGRYISTVDELARPLLLTIEYIRAEALPTFAFYGAEYDPSEADIESSAAAYIKHIEQVSAKPVSCAA